MFTYVYTVHVYKYTRAAYKYTRALYSKETGLSPRKHERTRFTVLQQPNPGRIVAACCGRGGGRALAHNMPQSVDHALWNFWRIGVVGKI